MTLEHRLSPLRKQGSTQCSGWIPVYTGMTLLNDLLVQSRKLLGAEQLACAITTRAELWFTQLKESGVSPEDQR